MVFVRRFYAPNMGLMVLKLILGWNEEAQIIYRQFKDMFHKGGLKKYLTFEWDMGTYRIYFIQSMDIGS